MGLLAHDAQLIGDGGDQGLQGAGAVLGRLAHLFHAVARLAQDLQKLGALAFEAHRQVFLLGAQGVAQGHQGGALLAQDLAGDLSLLVHGDAGLLQAQGLAREILAGRPGGLARRAGGQGQVGGAGGQGGLGLVDLGLGQVRGLGHQARMAGDGAADIADPRFQQAGQGGEFLALLAQALDHAGRVAHGVGAYARQPTALLGQQLAQRQQLGARLVGGGAGGADLHTDRFDRRAGPGRRDRRWGQHLLGQGLQPARLGQQLRAPQQGIGADPYQADGGQSQQRQEGESKALVREGADLGAQPQHIGQQPADPQHGRGSGEAPDQPRGAGGLGPGRWRTPLLAHDPPAPPQ